VKEEENEGWGAGEASPSVEGGDEKRRAFSCVGGEGSRNEMEFFFGRKSKAWKKATKQSLHSLPLSSFLFFFLIIFFLHITRFLSL
jgi:hypothetical protein